jgi:cytochrome c556
MRFKSTTFFICIAICATLSLLAGEKAPDSYVKLMKSAGATAGSLRKDSEAKDYSGVAKDAATFRSIYADAKTFWDARNIETASSALSAGAKAAADLQAAAEGKNDEGITAASQALMRSCGACHSTHREKVADGYEIK